MKYDLVKLMCTIFIDGDRIMTKYNHAFDVAFIVISEKEDATDVTPMMLAVALNKRIASLLNDDEFLEAVGCPFDTYEMEVENG